jgi:acetyl esterase/lipase
LGFALMISLARAAPWRPAAGHEQIPLWPGIPPDPQPVTDAETVTVTGPGAWVAGRPVVIVTPVTAPTLTVYRPTVANTGVAVVVFPGGGYQELAIDLEGTEACDWLTAKGITCVLSKYRVPGEHRPFKSGGYPRWPQALEDAQRTVGLVRFHAAEWKIDPNKIGVLGFSAGGHLVAATSTHFKHRLYAPVDAADRVSCRPDFGLAIYPGHLSLADNSIALNPDIKSHLTSETPPTFLVQNEDDDVDRVEDALSYYVGLKAAHVPVEMHLYAQGRHAFGLRASDAPVTTAWPRLAETWLHTIGMLPNIPQ